MNLSGFSFERPYLWMALFLIVPLLLISLRNKFFFEKTKTLLGDSWNEPHEFTKFVRFIFPSLIFVLIVISFMGPRGNPHYSEAELTKRQNVEISANQSTWHIIIDTSRSMLATDTPSKETRLESAKELADLLLREPSTSNIVLWALGSDLVKIVPKTQDRFFTRFLLNELQVDEGGQGTDFLAAFTVLGQDLKNLAGPQSLFIFTDGDDTTYQALGTMERKNRLLEIVKAVQIEPEEKIFLYSIGFGTAEGGLVPDVVYKGAKVTSRLDMGFLTDLSTVLNGRAFSFNILDSAYLIKQLIDLQTVQANELISAQASQARDSLTWDSYFQIPLFLAAFLFLIFLMFPDSFKSKVVKKINTQQTLIKKTLQQGSLAFVLASGSLVERQVQIFLEAGDSEKAEELLNQNSVNVQQSDWEKEAILYNRALLMLEKGERDKVFSAVNKMAISETSSPWVLEQMALLKARLELEEGEKEALPSSEILALYSLKEAFHQSCLFEKEKGYENCLPSFLIDEMKKKVKGNLSVPKQKKSSSLDRLAEVYEWLDNLALVQANPLYFEPLKAGLHSSEGGWLKDALNNFQQKDFSESLEFFQKEQKKLATEVSNESFQKNLEAVLAMSGFSKYHLIALGDDRLKPALEQILKGHLLNARFLIEDLLQKVKFAGAAPKNPIGLLEKGVDQQRSVWLLKEIQKRLTNFDGSELINRAQNNVMAVARPFVPISYESRVKEFLDKGCETAPWNLVIPHFEGGIKAISKEQDLVVIKEWNEAIRLLKNPPPKGQTPQSKESLSDSVRQFRDLEQADKSLNASEPAVNKVDKPW